MGKNWKCRIGLHNWHVAGFASLVMPSTFDYCGRCMIGRVVMWTGTIRYTPEQVKQALLDNMRRNGAEIAP